MTIRDSAREGHGLGDILVHKGEPPESNPYRGCGRTEGEPTTCVTGLERSKALGKFLRLGEVGDYTFWYAPTMGGSKRYDKPPEVHAPIVDFYWDEEGNPKSRRRGARG